MAPRPVRHIRSTTLRRRSSWSAWSQFGFRIGLMAALLVLVIGFHWLERESLLDQLDGHVSFTDILYFTMISATTTGYGDIVPVTDTARLFDALVVTPIRIFFILILAGTAYTFVIRRSWNKWVMRQLQKTLNDHIIIAGFGTSGSQALDELIARGQHPGTIVVIDRDPERVETAEALGCIVLQGDATRDETLKAVHVERARSIIISAGSDDTSILMTLTARHLAPDVKVTVIVRNADNEVLARQAGATTVINPVSFAGLLLAGSAQEPNIADYLSDLASAYGRVRLAEREVRPDECGRSLADLATGLGVRVYRGGKPIGFWEEAAHELQTGDKIIEIVPATEHEADLPLAVHPYRPRQRPDEGVR